MIKTKIENDRRIIPTSIVESLEENYFEAYETYDGFFENLEIWIKEEGVEKVVECGFKLNREYGNLSEYDQIWYLWELYLSYDKRSFQEFFEEVHNIKIDENISPFELWKLIIRYDLEPLLDPYVLNPFQLNN